MFNLALDIWEIFICNEPPLNINRFRWNLVRNFFKGGIIDSRDESNEIQTFDFQGPL